MKQKFVKKKDKVGTFFERSQLLPAVATFFRASMYFRGASQPYPQSQSQSQYGSSQPECSQLPRYVAPATGGCVTDGPQRPARRALRAQQSRADATSSQLSKPDTELQQRRVQAPAAVRRHVRPPRAACAKTARATLGGAAKLTPPMSSDRPVASRRRSAAGAVGQPGVRSGAARAARRRARRRGHAGRWSSRAPSPAVVTRLAGGAGAGAVGSCAAAAAREGASDGGGFVSPRLRLSRLASLYLLTRSPRPSLAAQHTSFAAAYAAQPLLRPQPSSFPSHSPLGGSKPSSSNPTPSSQPPSSTASAAAAFAAMAAPHAEARLVRCAARPVFCGRKF